MLSPLLSQVSLGFLEQHPEGSFYAYLGTWGAQSNIGGAMAPSGPILVTPLLTTAPLFFLSYPVYLLLFPSPLLPPASPPLPISPFTLDFVAPPFIFPSPPPWDDNPITFVIGDGNFMVAPSVDRLQYIMITRSEDLLLLWLHPGKIT